MYIARGITYIITNAHPVSGIPAALNVIGIGKIGPVPVAALIWFVLAVIMYCVMRYTVFGQYIYAIGGSENATWLSGVNVNKIRVISYVISGVFASLAGFIIIFRLMIATADAATSYEMTAIASCVIGGISLNGGRGSVIGSVIGTLVFGLILNMLQLLGVSSFWQSAITGLVIIIVAVSTVSPTAARNKGGSARIIRRFWKCGTLPKNSAASRSWTALISRWKRGRFTLW